MKNGEVCSLVQGKEPARSGERGPCARQQGNRLIQRHLQLRAGIRPDRLANPALGVRKNKESGRDTYIEDDRYQAVWTAADAQTQDAMDLAYLCGQRPADTLKFTDDDVRESFLHTQQGKIKAKLRIEIKGELAAVVRRIEPQKGSYKSSSTSLIVNERGQPLSAAALRDRFDKAREAAGVPKNQFQFRDLRAKAGTDKTESSGNIRQAQKQLGHGSATMTEHYVRNRMNTW